LHRQAILDWTNPGAGGFYDDLGWPWEQSHLVTGPAFADAPDFMQGPLRSFPFRNDPPVPVEFDIPAEAIQRGELTPTWETEHGRDGNPGGSGVSEVWLIKHSYLK
jgi:hypothetical protein